MIVNALKQLAAYYLRSAARVLLRATRLLPAFGSRFYYWSEGLCFTPGSVFVPWSSTLITSSGAPRTLLGAPSFSSLSPPEGSILE